ncbi:unnamed protein product [Caenorhabditis sp. 36 PRJEB53466]|nr:unnamed protein product [Caenorhabditis sp. 36 PRJEB53466]
MSASLRYVQASATKAKNQLIRTVEENLEDVERWKNSTGEELRTEISEIEDRMLEIEKKLEIAEKAMEKYLTAADEVPEEDDEGQRAIDEYMTKSIEEVDVAQEARTQLTIILLDRESPRTDQIHLGMSSDIACSIPDTSREFSLCPALSQTLSLYPETCIFSKMSKDPSIGWMYEGAKGNVHREDYLLGKKIDKNFEKYSDVVNNQKAEAIDSIVSTRTVFASGESSGLKTTSLQKDIIKSEDPLVAVRVREETKRRAIMDNPLMKMKLQNTLKAMMASKIDKKKEKKSKKEKKDKKKKKKRSRSSSSSRCDSSEERPKKETVIDLKNREAAGGEIRVVTEKETVAFKNGLDPEASREEKVPAANRDLQDENGLDRGVLKGAKRELQKSKDRGQEVETGHTEDLPDRHDVRDPRVATETVVPLNEQVETTEKKTKDRDLDRPILIGNLPRDHLQKKKHSSDSDSDSERRPSHRHDSDDERQDPRKKAYGLVEMRKRTAEEREEEARTPSKEFKLVKLPTGRGGDKKREPRRVLTDEEKAARLAEMQQDNVKWRDEVRAKNVEKGREEDEEEKDEADKNGYAPSFIRSQMRDACEDMTVEKRLQSRKGGVQRSHGYMDRSFARK